jgi:hypothetical protein
MTYNFTDAPTPSLPTAIMPATNNVELVAGSPQGDYITAAYGGSTVTVTIVPPSGWTLTTVTWSGGSNILTVPRPGVEDSHDFSYTVTQGGTSKTNGGVFKIKRAGT